MKVPISVRNHLANAHYYLGALKRLPQPVTQAVRILLLLTAWEHMHIATELLRSKIWKSSTSRKLFRDHQEKLRGVRGPIIQLRDAGADQLIEKAYLSPSELSSLLEICRYGPKGGSARLDEFFDSKWFTDEFERDLDSRIRWLEVEIKIFDDIQSGKNIEFM